MAGPAVRKDALFTGGASSRVEDIKYLVDANASQPEHAVAAASSAAGSGAGSAVGAGVGAGVGTGTGLGTGDGHLEFYVDPYTGRALCQPRPQPVGAYIGRLYGIDSLGAIAVVTYEEWQRDAITTPTPNTGRLCTGVLTLEGVDKMRWIHMHQTWLPPDRVAEETFEF